MAIAGSVTAAYAFRRTATGGFTQEKTTRLRDKCDSFDWALDKFNKGETVYVAAEYAMQLRYLLQVQEKLGVID